MLCPFFYSGDAMKTHVSYKRKLLLAGFFSLCLSFTAQILAQSDILPAKTLSSGSTWVVDKTTRLNGLTIAEGAALKAPTGHSLTLSVDGTEYPIKPGFYEGNVVLTVTDEINVKYRDLAPHHFRTALYIEDGKIVPSKSVQATIASGEVTGENAKDVSITSTGDRFNGILVTGNSKYRIENPAIEFTGNGGDDFAGFGAALMSSGHADVTVENAKITTRGAVRTAIFVGGNSTMHVNNSFIDTYNGVLPADYKFNISLGNMFEAPWVLGVMGNVRAMNVVDNGVIYYNNSHIRTHGWGALSSDDPKNVRIYATNTLIETIGSGYGTYAIGDGINTFSHCTFNVADVGAIIAGTGTAIFTDGTVVNSGRYGVTAHSGSGGTLTIEKGSVFNTKSTAIEAKGRGIHIMVDDAKINAGNGVILQALINDDPYANNPAAAASVGVPIGGPPAAAASPASNEKKKESSTNVEATFKNVALNGDFINSMTSLGDMNLRFEKATITGAISTATAIPSTGQTPTRGTYYLIGDVKNTLTATNDKFGVKVSLDGVSTWTVNKTSYLTGLTLAQGASLAAPQGSTLTMTVNGARTPIKAGSYTGKVVLLVAPGA
jgi:hypothetical protein